jgi:hypothetical protein
MSTLSQNDAHRPYPDSADDAAMDLAEAAWVAMCEADDAVQDAEQAERVMSEDADDLADLREAARVQRERADAEMAEADRLERLADRTASRIASGNLDIMAAVCGTLSERRAS